MLLANQILTYADSAVCGVNQRLSDLIFTVFLLVTSPSKLTACPDIATPKSWLLKIAQIELHRHVI